MTCRYYRVGDQTFSWLFERPEDLPEGYSQSPTRVSALAKARALAVACGLPVELRAHTRMNDFVGPPIWGEDCLIAEVALQEDQARARLSALAA